LSKKRARSPGRTALEAVASAGRAKMPRTDDLGRSGDSLLRTRWGSPWEKYEKAYDLELGGPVVGAVQKASPVQLVHVRAFPQRADTTLSMIRRIQHNNVFAALDVFMTDEILYIVFEHMPLSLDQLVGCPAYPNEEQLAAVVGQVSSTRLGVGLYSNDGRH
jgi:hypothetical protein